MYKFRLFTTIYNVLTPRKGDPRALPRARVARTRARRARGNVSLSVRQRHYAVRWQVPFVVDKRQTYFRQFASGGGVVLRSEGPKRARRGVPPVQHVQVLFVSHPFLDVVLRHAFCLREGVSRIIGSWRPERVHFRPESTKLRRKYGPVSDLKNPSFLLFLPE